MASTTATVQQSYIDLRALNLGMPLVREAGLVPGRKYAMVLDGLSDVDLEGTLDKSGLIGGLSRMYRDYDLQVGDKVSVQYDGSVLRLSPPPEKQRKAISSTDTGQPTQGEEAPVFERQKLRHVHVEPYAPGNLRNWVPRTEPDVYMVFGALSEYTDFRYCCGISQALLDQLGYTAPTKPDAILIDRTTGQYLIAEFKMNSKEFGTNHQPEDVDVLICWDDDATDRSKLPPTVLGLRNLLERAVRDGDIDL